MKKIIKNNTHKRVLFSLPIELHTKLKLEAVGKHITITDHLTNIIIKHYKERKPQ